MKKLIAVMLAVIMLMTLLAGCGAKKEETPAAPATSESSSSKSDSGSADKTEEKASEPVELRLMTWVPEIQNGNLIEVVNKILEPENIVVVYEFVDNDNYDNIVNTQMASGQGPDLLECGGQFSGQQKAVYCTDFTDAEWTKNFHESYLDFFTIDGKLWGVPDAAFVAGIAYNKDIFEKYNIEIPTTWDDLLSVGDRLAAAGFTGRPFVTGAADLGVASWPTFGVLNSTLYSDESKKAFDDQFALTEGKVADAWKEPLEKYWIPFMEKYYTVDMIGLTGDQAQNEFALGDVAMCAGGTMGMGGFAEIVQSINPDMNVGIFAYPAVDGGTGWAVGSTGNCFTANPNGKHLEEAKKAIAAIASAEAQYELAGGMGPIGHKDLDLPLPPEFDDTMLEAANAGHLYATWCKWPNAGTVLEHMTKALHLLMQGEYSLDEYLQAIDEANAMSFVG